MAEGEPETATFHWADYLVFGLFLVFNAGLGVVIGIMDRKKTSTKEFLMGGGNMHWVPVALSMQASFLSAIFILSTPVEIYTWGTTYSYLGISYLTAIPIAGYMYLPTFYRLRLVSAYEYLERRFNRAVRVAGSLTFCVMALLYMAVVLYTPAIALVQVTGLPKEFSILLCGLVCTIYTVVGGMKATIWNDFIQMITILVGLLVIICLGAVEHGGMANIWKINEEGGRSTFNVFDPDPTIRTSFWTQTIGGTFVSLTMYASSQTIIQKYLSVKTLPDAKKSIWLASITSLLYMILVVIVGLIMYAHFADCDPILSNKVEKSDQMVPLLVMEVMGHLHGLPGLFIATAFSAALSSVSGSVNALAAVTLMDFVRPIYFRCKNVELSDKSSAILSRVLTLIYGLLTTGMGFLAEYMGDLVLQIALSIFGFVGGPLTALISLGLFFPFVNSWGALAGLICSLGICSWIAVGAIVANYPEPTLPVSTEGCWVDQNGSFVTPNMNYSTYTDLSDYTWITTAPGAPEGPADVLWIYKVSHMYYGLIAMVIAFVVGIVVSLITGVAKDTDPKLLFSWGNECCCCCPMGCRQCLRCGAGEEVDSDTEQLNEDIEKKEVYAGGVDNPGLNYVQYNEKDTIDVYDGAITTVETNQDSDNNMNGGVSTFKGEDQKSQPPDYDEMGDGSDDKNKSDDQSPDGVDDSPDLDDNDEDDLDDTTF